MIGLLATAFGAHSLRGRLGPEDLGVGTLVALVCGAFFSFVAGGWVAARIVGSAPPLPRRPAAPRRRVGATVKEGDR